MCIMHDQSKADSQYMKITIKFKKYDWSNTQTEWSTSVYPAYAVCITYGPKIYFTSAIRMGQIYVMITIYN